MTGTISPVISPDHLLLMREEAKVLPVVLSGILDKKLDEFKALKAELAQRQGAVATLAEAEKIKVDAAANAKAVFDTAEQKAKTDTSAARQMMHCGLPRSS